MQQVAEWNEANNLVISNPMTDIIELTTDIPNTLDQAGIALSTGVYIYRISVNNSEGSYSNAKKMLLVK
jgi:hypothetical protein